jgi:hypothetical protein
MRNYLASSKLRCGLLLNFGTLNLKDMSFFRRGRAARLPGDGVRRLMGILILPRNPRGAAPPFNDRARP